MLKIIHNKIKISSNNTIKELIKQKVYKKECSDKNGTIWSIKIKVNSVAEMISTLNQNININHN